MNTRIFVLSSFLSILSCLNINGQTHLDIEGPFMYTRLSIHNSSKVVPVKALIDTGCSLCVIDSTFAIDSLQIEQQSLNSILLNGSVGAYRSIIDSLVFCEKKYRNVPCVITNLSERFRQHAPQFILGADILKNGIWKFDTKAHTIEEFVTKQTPSNILKWKDHRELSDAALYSINFEGKVGGKKIRFLFDTGSRSNEIPIGLGVVASKIIPKEAASIDKTLTIEEVNLYEGVTLEIQKCYFTIDFLSTKEEVGYLNKDFLQGKTFILNYKKKRLEIIE